MDTKMHMMETRSLRQIKMLLHTKGNNYQSENIFHKWDIVLKSYPSAGD
jgi:hypothetical protein